MTISKDALIAATLRRSEEERNQRTDGTGDCSHHADYAQTLVSPFASDSRKQIAAADIGLIEKSDEIGADLVHLDGPGITILARVALEAQGLRANGAPCGKPRNHAYGDFDIFSDIIKHFAQGSDENRQKNVT